MPSDDAVYVHVKIGTGAVEALVYHVDVEDVDRGADKCTLVMVDPNSTSADALLEGQTVEVELGWETEKALIFEGIVRQVRPVAQDTHRVEIVAYDLSSRMARPLPPDLPRQHVGTLRDILREMVKRYKIPFGSVQIDPMPSWPEGAPLLLGNRTDWELVQDLAEEYHARAFVEVNATPEDSRDVHARGGMSRFYFISEAALLAQDPMGKLKFCHGFGSLLEFDYKRVGSGASPSTSGTVTDPGTGDPVPLQGAAPAEGPAPAVDSARSAAVATVSGEGSARAYEGAVQAATEAPERPADLRARRTAPPLPSDPHAATRAIEQDRTRVLGFYGHGVAMGTVFLRAKGSVLIEGLASWSSGQWYVSRVNHIVQRQTIRLRGTDTTRYTYRSRFVATR
jgi:hypothetical protein